MDTTLQGKKVPGLPKWKYTLYVDGREHDFFYSATRLSAEEMLSVQNGYSEGLDGYVLGGVR